MTESLVDAQTRILEPKTGFRCDTMGGHTERAGDAQTSRPTAPGNEVLMHSKPTAPRHDTAWYAQLAERATEAALNNIRQNEDAGAELSLAAAVWDVVMGMATPDQIADLDEYELTDDSGYRVAAHGCICPPDLLARGGFKGGCLVHA